MPSVYDDMPEPKGNPGKEGESVDVMEETLSAAADEIMSAVNAGDSGGLKTALKEFVRACK